MRWMLVALAAAVTGLAAIACEAEEERVPEAAIPADEIAGDDEGTYVGQEVLVAGEIEEIVDPRGYTLAPGLLVVIDEIHEEQRSQLATGAFVQVLGVVREFEPAAIEEEVNASLDPELYEEYEGEPVVVMTRMQILDPEELPDPGGVPKLPGENERDAPPP